jgi:hypothetical protein
MCSVAILLWICRVSAATSAHGFLLLLKPEIREYIVKEVRFLLKHQAYEGILLLFEIAESMK